MKHPIVALRTDEIVQPSALEVVLGAESASPLCTNNLCRLNTGTCTINKCQTNEEFCLKNECKENLKPRPDCPTAGS